MGKKTVKELRTLAQVHNVRVRSGASKSEIIYLLGENYGERRRAYFEREVGLWESEVKVNEETIRWNQEIQDEERSRQPLGPAKPRLTKSALGGSVQRWFVDGGEYLDPDVFLYDIADGVRRVVDSVNGSKKVHMNLSCVLEKEDPKTGNKEEDKFGARSGTYTVTVKLGDTYDEMKDKIRENLSKFQRNGSGWRLKSIIGLGIGIVKFDPMEGSGYSKLPTVITKKKAVINMMNKECKKRCEECDQCEESKMCFKWAVTRALNPVDDNPQRVTKDLREQAEKHKWEGITFPTKVKDIHIWEKNNNININVFGYDDEAKKIYTIKIAELKDPLKTINLFLHDDKEKELGKRSLLEIHEELCSGQKLQHSIYPKPGETTKFRNVERLHDVPFAVYADFESFVEPVQYTEQDPSKSFTNKYQNHIPSGFCYVIKCMDESVYPTKTVLKTASYEGEDMGKAFVDSLTEDLKPVYEILKDPKPMCMNDSEKSKHEKAKECYACKDVFGTMRMNKKSKKEEKVTKWRDHCHITGKYRGAACDRCNLRMRVPMFVPVLFHNLEGYDSHLFVKSLGLTEGDIKCIPKTDEKYISFGKNILMGTFTTDDGKERTAYLEMRFIDSLKFMRGSLDSLAKTLGKDQFKTLTNQMLPQIPKGHNRIESLNLLKQKGVFPYEYMTDFFKLSATSLPPKDAFYSQLSGSGISDEDYMHAQKVWRAFSCKTMKDYHDLYLKTDVLLLADRL